MESKTGPSLIKKIGEGSFGEVWQAEDPQREAPIVVKFLRLDIKASPENIELFKREFEILTKLKHAHLAQVYDFGYSQAKESYYFTSEFCPGVDLLAARRQNPELSLEEVLVQILSALDYIHSEGVIHFDLKPENILVANFDREPDIKLLDFGVAGKIRSLPQGRGGTLTHMAPELLDVEQKIDHRVDLYSLGIICYQLLTDQLPFDEKNSKAIMKWHLTGSLPKNFDMKRPYPSYLVELTHKLLAKNPSDRFSSARVALNFINLSTHGKFQKTEIELQSQIPTEGPLVEREAILDKIQKHMNTCCGPEKNSHGPSVLFLKGEPGIGKTRILDEVRHLAQLKEIKAVSLTCDWEIPAWPRLMEALNLSGLFHDDPTQEWQVRRKVDALLGAAQQTPLCLLLDDFHKAEPELKQLLNALAQDSQATESTEPGPKIFILGATEQTEPRALELQRLSAEGVSRYLRLTLGESDRLEALARLLYEYSGGLPLLVVEGLRFLAPHFYQGESLENLLPPPEIGSLYKNRLSNLSSQELELLQILSLLFRPTKRKELISITKKDSVEINRDLEALNKQGLLKEAIAGRVDGKKEESYQVSNQALALNIINGLTENPRKLLHLKIAQGLAGLTSTKVKIPPQEIAYHLGKGGKKSEAIEFYRRATEIFKSQSLITSATENLEKAIQLTPSDSPLRRELLEEICQLLIVSGNYSEANAYLEKLDRISQGRQEELKGYLAFKQRNFPEASRAYQAALEACLPEDTSKKILLENSLANIELQQGNFQAAAERFKKTLAWENKLDHQDNSSSEEKPSANRNNLGLALALLGEIEGALDFYQNRLDRLSPDREEDEISLLNGLGFVYLKASRYQEAIPILKRAMILAEKTGALHTLFALMGNLTTALLKEGRYPETLAILKKMGNYQERLGTRRDVAYNLLRQASVYINLGMKELSLGVITKGQDIAKEAKESGLEAWFQIMLGYYEKEFGDPSRALKIFLESQEMAEKIQDPSLVGWALMAQAELAYDQDKVNQGLAILEKIQDNASDEEFSLRLELLRTKFSELPEAREKFAQLESICIKKHFQRNLWELYQAWANLEWKLEDYEAAISLVEKGVSVTDAIAQGLPEEYRDRYLNQRTVKKLYDDREKMNFIPKKGFFQKVKKLFIHR